MAEELPGAKKRELSALLEQRDALNEAIAQRADALALVVDEDTLLTGDYRRMFQEIFWQAGGVHIHNAWKLETVERDEYMLCAAGYLLNDEEDTPHDP